MEMCYDGALVMPSNCAVMNEEEMTYVVGGTYYTYKGAAAFAELSVMYACVFSLVGVTARLISFCATTATTGVGLVLAVAASAYTLADGGFKAESYGVWKISVYTGVKAL